MVARFIRLVVGFSILFAFSAQAQRAAKRTEFHDETFVARIKFAPQSAKGLVGDEIGKYRMVSKSHTQSFFQKLFETATVNYGYEATDYLDFDTSYQSEDFGSWMSLPETHFRRLEKRSCTTSGKVCVGGFFFHPEEDMIYAKNSNDQFLAKAQAETPEIPGTYGIGDYGKEGSTAVRVDDIAYDPETNLEFIVGIGNLWNVHSDIYVLDCPEVKGWSTGNCTMRGRVDGRN